jgi:predicted Fe-Mo cluster-binding NifX family protein
VAHQHDQHQDAVALIADCDVVLARGMGNGMYQRLQAANIRPILTTIGIIETAVIAYAEGRLKEHPELVH